MRASLLAHRDHVFKMTPMPSQNTVYLYRYLLNPYAASFVPLTIFELQFFPPQIFIALHKFNEQGSIQRCSVLFQNSNKYDPSTTECFSIMLSYAYTKMQYRYQSQ